MYIILQYKKTIINTINWFNFFYSFWKIENLPLLLFSIVLNYLIGNVIVITKNKFYTFIGITINILLLFHFKYALYTLNLFNSEFENNSSFFK